MLRGYRWIGQSELIEPAMFFFAGLLVSGLAGLLILPAFARRALRLSAARARLLAPLSVKDIVAERDLLRAEHALERHRLERRLATLQERSALHRADLGRRAAEIVALEGTISAQGAELSALGGELASRQRTILALEAEVGASQLALRDFDARFARAAAEIEALREARVSLETAADAQRATIAGLETRAAGLEMKLDDMLRLTKSGAGVAEIEKAGWMKELRAAAASVARMNAELAAAATNKDRAAAALEKAVGELDRTRRRLAEVEAVAARERATYEAGESAARKADKAGFSKELRAAAEAVARMNAELGAALASKDKIEIAMARTSGELDRARRRLVELEAELAARDGALAQARQSAVLGPAASATPDDRALREAIAQLAADVVRLMAPGGEASPPRANLHRLTPPDPPSPPAPRPSPAEGMAPAQLRQLQSTAWER